MLIRHKNKFSNSKFKKIKKRKLLSINFMALVELNVSYGIFVRDGVFNNALDRLNIPQNFKIMVILRQEKQIP